MTLQEELKQALESRDDQKLEHLLAMAGPKLSAAITTLQKDPELKNSLKRPLNQFSAMLRFKQSLQKALKLPQSAYRLQADYDAMNTLNQNFTYKRTQAFTAQLNKNLAPAPTAAPSPSPTLAPGPTIAPQTPKPRHVPKFEEELYFSIQLLQQQVDRYEQQPEPKHTPIPSLRISPTPRPPGT